MSDVIEPSWSVFGPCPRCGATDGAPCHDMRGVPKGYYPNRRPTGLKNPHKGRQQVRN